MLQIKRGGQPRLAVAVVSFSIHFEDKDSANRVQNHQACLSVMPRCSLSYAKIVQIERNDKGKLVFICISECSLSYLKIVQIEDNAKQK